MDSAFRPLDGAKFDTLDRQKPQQQGKQLLIRLLECLSSREQICTLINTLQILQQPQSCHRKVLNKYELIQSPRA